jgi:hypothetical protein
MEAVAELVGREFSAKGSATELISLHAFGFLHIRKYV